MTTSTFRQSSSVQTSVLKCVCGCCLHRLGCTCKSTCGAISASHHEQQHRKTHSSTQLGPSRHCRIEAGSAAQSVRSQNKQKHELGNNSKLANTQPEAPLTSQTTLCGPNVAPCAPQSAGWPHNHRRHVRHWQHQNRQQQSHPSCTMSVCVCVGSSFLPPLLSVAHCPNAVLLRCTFCRMLPVMSWLALQMLLPACCSCG